VNGHAGEQGFKAQGKVIVTPGWRTVLDNKGNSDTPQDASSDDKLLPPFTAGESGAHIPSLQKKTTQPPKPYNEGTLLRAMETAGRTVDDEELREAMKENGIGRPSTRAAIIETLFKRGFLRRERKNIIPTQAGIELIATIGQELLKSAKLTGIWENKLRRIERGDFKASEFLEELKAQVNEIVRDVLNDSSQRKIEVVQGDEAKASEKAPKTTKRKKKAEKS
ncbi:MAG: DNA topoisomerase III, partial [Muribaculaceae bacterium]|nr:DNA topoisomerase III [Muribaculaceae bacterium]